MQSPAERRYYLHGRRAHARGIAGLMYHAVGSFLLSVITNDFERLGDDDERQEQSQDNAPLALRTPAEVVIVLYGRGSSRVARAANPASGRMTFESVA